MYEQICNDQLCWLTWLPLASLALMMDFLCLFATQAAQIPSQPYSESRVFRIAHIRVARIPSRPLAYPSRPYFETRVALIPQASHPYSRSML